MNKLKVLDLFSGVGGFSLGLERTGGFETIAFCEKDKHAQRVLSKHWPRTQIFDDVSKLEYIKDDGINSIGEKEHPPHYIENIDIITGGFPCQDISFAGARNGIKAERSGLWSEYCRLISEIRPKYAIIENVEYLRKNGLGVVLNDLARIGYDAEWSCITARSVGLPHQRKRLFIVSYPSSIGLNGDSGEKRYIQTNSEWESQAIYSKGPQCESKPITVCPILSRRAFENIRNTRTDQRATLSNIRRVTNGLPEGLDERRRKQRIKQLGNAIVPDIAEIIGKAILNREGKI